MKKLIIFGSIIVVLFIATAVLTNMAEKETVKNNPYGKEQLDTETAKLLEDPNYQNLILPDELDKKLADQEEVTVYFFSPRCEFCREATPRLMQVANKMNVDVKQFNLLEFRDGYDDFNIKNTPTLVHYKDGVEVDRLVGAAPDEEFERFFETNIGK
ncbi:thioredoxin family protein [Bacillaceae bacterium W0354]